MGRGSGGGGRAGLNAFARARGFRVVSTPKGKYSLSIRDGRGGNIVANTLTEARKLISSVSARTRRSDREHARYVAAIRALPPIVRGR